MLKVTIKFTGWLFFYFVLSLGCGHADDSDADKDAALHRADSLSEARIDSAYKAITDSCDTLRVHMMPRFVDSLMKKDTAYMDSFLNSRSLFIDSNKKVEKIVRELQADCDSGLRRETFKRKELIMRSKKVAKGKGTGRKEDKRS